MNIKKSLSLAARIFGLLILFNGLSALIDLMFILSLGDVEPFFIAYVVAITAFYLGSGAYLLRGAPGIINFAFRQKPGASDLDADD